MSFFTRRRSSKTSCWSSSAVRSVTSRLTTTFGAWPSHPRGRRARDAEVRGDGHVPGALNEIPKPVVVALLRAGRGRHGHDHRPFPHAAQPLENIRASAGVTTTRARKCKLSVGTARRDTGASPSDMLFAICGVCRCRGLERKAARQLNSVRWINRPYRSTIPRWGMWNESAKNGIAPPNSSRWCTNLERPRIAGPSNE